MKRKQIKAMVHDLLEEIDYDISKDYVKETAEEPEYVDENLEKLIVIVKKHIKLSKKESFKIVGEPYWDWTEK